MTTTTRLLMREPKNVQTKSVALSLLAFLISSVFASELVASERPNIVWIISDDLSPELGCYGYPDVQTPNIDRLSEQGAKYTRAFSTSPVCSSSRSAFITGVYQTATGTHQHRTSSKKPLPGSIKPITELMRQSGYFVCNSNSAMNRAGKTDYNFSSTKKAYDGVDWADRKDGQPFFAQIQIHEPHRTFDKASSQRRSKKHLIPAYYPDHPVIRADWADYLETVETLDQNVGKVLDRLKREGVEENTVVFFFGDHGRPHYRDKQWLYDGGIRVPLIVRWPDTIPRGAVSDQLVSLIDVSATTIAAAGIELPTWIQGQDMLSSEFDGRDKIFAARDRCGSTIDRIRCVRTQRFKYIRNFYPDRPYVQHSNYKELQYPGMTVARVMKQNGQLSGPPAAFWSDRRPAEELYDTHADPDELINLASDPDHQSTLNKLRGDLKQWMLETNDQGEVEETDLEETIQSSDNWYQATMKKRGLSVEISAEDYIRWWEQSFGLK